MIDQRPNLTDWRSLGQWLQACDREELLAMLADLAIAMPETFEASRRRAAARIRFTETIRIDRKSTGTGWPAVASFTARKGPP